MIFHDILQDLAALLYDAAEEEGYIDPSKVEEILEISPDEARSTKITNENPVHQTPKNNSSTGLRR